MAKKRKKKSPKKPPPIKIVKRDQRYERFCKEYVIDLNGKRAAIAAGYSASTAESKASQMLRIDKVKARIAELQEKKSDKLGSTAEKVLGELMRLGFSNISDYITIQGGDAYVDLSELTREQAAAIQAIEVETYVEGNGKDAKTVKRTKFKLVDKTRSLDLLGKHLKLFTDRVQLEGLDGLAEKIAAGRKRVKDKR